MSEDPRIAAQFGLARRHHQAGRLAEAERLYRQICALDAGHAESWHLLGVVAHQLGREDAAAHLARAVMLKPDFAQGHNDLGVVLAAQGKFAEAAASFARAAKLAPDHAEAQLNLGLALGNLGQFGEAAASFERALALRPDFPPTHLQLGNALRAQGKLEQAVPHYERAVLLAPNFAEAHNDLGHALSQLGSLDGAVVHLKRAVALKPDFAGAHNNLANALRELGRLEEALSEYDRALTLQPRFVPAHYNRGVAWRRLGKVPEATACFERALKIAPDFLEAKFALCIAQLPVLYAHEAQIAQSRADYQRCLTALRDDVEHSPRLADLAEVVGAHQPFYLAYQGYSDRDLQALYGAIVCRIMAARYPPAALPKPPEPQEPVRVGIVSAFFRQHSNWKIPIRGWLSQLDRRRFRLFGYHLAAERDAQTQAAAALCQRFLEGPLPLERWRAAILADAPHVLIYPEVGMDPVSARLAALRLAPVQCGSWGHPDTSGYPSLDYFLSSELMEPADAQDHYTERLIRLPNLSIYYEPPDLAPVALDRAALGLRRTATVYWCSQSVYKYLPQFDPVFARIARQAGDCQFTFIEFPGAAHITEMFRSRLERAFAAFDLRAADHCVFLPRLEPPQFLAAIGQCDVVLDSIGWSGCNSILESLAHDLPIVTMTGPLMRGRHATAILQMLGIPETVTGTIDEYVATAVRLAQDAALRASLKSRVAANKHRVYRDRRCIAALEEFLDQQARSANP